MPSPANRAAEIPPSELARYRDAEWALHDSEVQRCYSGQWVVAFEGRIIAHGSNPRAVAAEASRRVGALGHRVVFCAAENPETWLEVTP
jgi:hypothetical protein